MFLVFCSYLVPDMSEARFGVPRRAKRVYRITLGGRGDPQNDEKKNINFGF